MLCSFLWGMLWDFCLHLLSVYFCHLGFFGLFLWRSFSIFWCLSCSNFNLSFIVALGNLLFKIVYVFFFVIIPIFYLAQLICYCHKLAQLLLLHKFYVLFRITSIPPPSLWQGLLLHGEAVDCAHLFSSSSAALSDSAFRQVGRLVFYIWRIISFFPSGFNFFITLRSRFLLYFKEY